MNGRSTRKIIKLGGPPPSKAITLPKDWVNKQDGELTEVHCIYNQVIVIFTDKDRPKAERIMKKAVDKAIQTI